MSSAPEAAVDSSTQTCSGEAQPQTAQAAAAAVAAPLAPPVQVRSQYRGLSWDKKHQGWRVRIYYAGKQRHVGRFDDDVAAAKAYDKAAVYLYGPAHAITNFGLESCLQDPTEVSSFIVLAKEQAEQAEQLAYAAQRLALHAGGTPHSLPRLPAGSYGSSSHSSSSCVTCVHTQPLQQHAGLMGHQPYLHDLADASHSALAAAAAVSSAFSYAASNNNANAPRQGAPSLLSQHLQQQPQQAPQLQPAQDLTYLPAQPAAVSAAMAALALSPPPAQQQQQQQQQQQWVASNAMQPQLVLPAEQQGGHTVPAQPRPQYVLVQVPLSGAPLHGFAAAPAGSSGAYAACAAAATPCMLQLAAVSAGMAALALPLGAAMLPQAPPMLAQQQAACPMSAQLLLQQQQQQSPLVVVSQPQELATQHHHHHHQQQQLMLMLAASQQQLQQNSNNSTHTLLN